MMRSVLVFFCLAAGLMHAQFGRRPAEWITAGSDAQRSRSISVDPKISVEGFEKPGFAFLWKRKLGDGPLTEATLMDRYIGYRGFRSFAFVGTSSNTVYGIDTDLNRVDWSKQLAVSAAASSSSACPGGMTSPIARPTSAGFPGFPSFGGLGGQGGFASSDVGAAKEGAVTIPAAIERQASARSRPPSGPPRLALLYAIASDGMLHAMYISNGIEPDPPVPFLPADSNAQGLIVIDGVAYAVSRACGGAQPGVWALDLGTKVVSHWSPDRGDIAGTGGAAFGPDGTIYIATTAGDLVSLDLKSLEVKHRYSAGEGFSSSPVVFAYKQRNVVAAADRSGRIHLVDAASLERALFISDASEFTTAAALSTWESRAGVRWLLAASDRKIAAWKIVDRDGAAALETAWVSLEMESPLPPMIINGVVFALATGRRQRPFGLIEGLPGPVVLYALDLATGKALWSSGRIIPSSPGGGGLSGEASQVYVETDDGTIYAFGFPIEH